MSDDFNISDHLESGIRDNAGLLGAAAALSANRQRQEAIRQQEAQRKTLEAQQRVLEEKAQTEKARLAVERQRLKLEQERQRQLEMQRLHIRSLRNLIADGIAELETLKKIYE